MKEDIAAKAKIIMVTKHACNHHLALSPKKYLVLLKIYLQRHTSVWCLTNESVIVVVRLSKAKITIYNYWD